MREAQSLSVTHQLRSAFAEAWWVTASP